MKLRGNETNNNNYKALITDNGIYGMPSERRHLLSIIFGCRTLHEKLPNETTAIYLKVGRWYLGVQGSKLDTKCYGTVRS